MGVEFAAAWSAFAATAVGAAAINIAETIIINAVLGSLTVESENGELLYALDDHHR